ncbi:2-haloacid dehalogenase [Nocardioides terrae]|uniref:2-haloacid dehalogenase n=1 Tax=Nocardioides terrae TaxID=574651 RepID=A0A1I1GZX5_9ACTN|nr:haloacid dehalogenase type II [Nocardioides terrae]SFC14510.1 2-haloacid dehalogenase [Nocardioides terrae]
MLLVLDVNETLLDLDPLDAVVGDALGVDPGAHAEVTASRRAWFDRMVRSALTLTAAGEYVAFGRLAVAALQDLAAASGRKVDDGVIDRLSAGIAGLPPHPDVAPGLRSLREAGHRVVTLTNSVLDVAHAQLDNSGLTGLVDAVYSADTVGRLKPAPEPYRHVLERESVAAADAVLVAAHDWDVAGAAAVGMATAFVAREGRRPFGAIAAPTYVVDDLAALAGALPAGGR